MHERTSAGRQRLVDPPEAVEDPVAATDPARRCDAGTDAQILGDGREQRVESWVTRQLRLGRHQQPQRVTVLGRAAAELEHQTHAALGIGGGPDLRGQVNEAEQSWIAGSSVTPRTCPDARIIRSRTGRLGSRLPASYAATADWLVSAN